MKNKMAIITLSAVSTIAIGISVYSTVTLNQKYKELESLTQTEEIETEPVEVATDNYNQRFEDLNTRITELENKLEEEKTKVNNLETQIQNYEENENLVKYIRSIYTQTDSTYFMTYSQANIFDKCMYWFVNGVTVPEDNEYYSYCSFK